MRAGARRSLLVLLTTVVLVAGCVSSGSPASPSDQTAGSPAATSTAAAVRPSSPPPSPTPSPTADPRPPLQFPDFQSHGTATLSFASPAIAPVTYQLSCFWVPEWYDDYDVDSGVETHEFLGATFLGVRASEPFSVSLAGEPVDVWLDAVQADPGYPDHLLVIHRHGAASYVAGPTTGTVELIEASADRTSGTLRFEGLAPDPETAPPGAVVLADWIKPLGGDPAMASLSGTLSWRCEPAPETIATYDLLDGGWPEGWPDSLGSGQMRCDPYPLVLVSGDQPREGGWLYCGPCDLCGPFSYSLDADQTVRVPVGGTLRFELADPGTHFLHWSLHWATQSEAEQATQHEQEGDFEFPSPFALIDEGRYSEGSVLAFPAPPPGEWSVSLGWHDHPAGYESGSFAPGSALFRVLVGD